MPSEECLPDESSGRATLPRAPDAARGADLTPDQRLKVSATSGVGGVAGVVSIPVSTVREKQFILNSFFKAIT